MEFKKNIGMSGPQITHSSDSDSGNYVQKESTTTLVMNSTRSCMATLAQHSHFLVPDEATGSQFPHRDVRSRWPLAGTPELDFVESFLDEKLDLLSSSSIKLHHGNCAETWSPSHSARSHRKRIAMGIPKGTDAFGIAPGRISPTKATANSIK